LVNPTAAVISSYPSLLLSFNIACMNENGLFDMIYDAFLVFSSLHNSLLITKTANLFIVTNFIRPAMNCTAAQADLDSSSFSLNFIFYVIHGTEFFTFNNCTIYK